MTPVETLRAAAARLRERAEAATPGVWESFQMPDAPGETGGIFLALDDREVRIGDDRHAVNDAAYIALMHPLVGLALAGWLDAVAGHWALAEDQADPHLPDADGWMTAIEDTLDGHALTLARLIPGGVA